MSFKANKVSKPARSLHISNDTVHSEFMKKETTLESVNTALLHLLNPENVLCKWSNQSKPRRMKCGQLAVAKATLAGSSMQLIMAREWSWRISLGRKLLLSWA